MREPRTRVRSVVLVVVSSVGLFAGLMAPVPAMGSSPVLEMPGEVFLGGLDAAERAALARPRRLALKRPIDVVFRLPELEMEFPAQTERRLGAPLRIAHDRELPAEWKVERRARDFVWEPGRDGGQVAVFAVTSPAAKGIRLAIDFHRLPAGAEVRFYSPAQASAAAGPFEAEFLRREARPGHPDGPFWSPLVDGDTIAVEIWVPSWKRGLDVRFALRGLSHVYRSLDPKSLEHIGRSAGCHRHVQCSKDWAIAANGVAKIVYQTADGGALCTGQLLTNRKGKNLLLTAAHCLSSKRDAKSATFFWFFQRAACNGEEPTSVTQTAGGARVLFTNLKNSTYWETDHTLLKLKRKPPQDVTRLGWTTRDTEENVGEKVTAIHHPRGDLKMVTDGEVLGVFELQEDNQTLLASDTPTHYQTSWNRRRGPTENGSSGSAIMVGRRFPDQFVIGVLTGGTSTCQNPDDSDFFGSFEKTMSRFKKFSKHFR